MATKKATSRILSEVHEAAQGLHKADLMDVRTMREFDALCLPPVPRYRAPDVRRIRAKADVSQGVFAAVLNVTKGTVAAWEQGEKAPSGPAAKLLEIVDRKGLDALA